VLIILLVIATYVFTDITSQIGINPGLIPVASILTILAAGYFLRLQREGWAFAMTALAIIFATLSTFQLLFPRLMVSSINPEYSLTIYNAASNPYTLRVMTIIALTLVPFVIAYQAWSYWVFRERITAESELEY
jgi:cytochrome d ubiquinol oxidase subunit II